MSLICCPISSISIIPFRSSSPINSKNPILDLGYYRNIPESTIKDPQKLQSLIMNMEKNYDPIEIKVPDGNNQFVFYDNSRLLNNLRYSPYILGLFILLYFGFSFWFFRTIKKRMKDIYGPAWRKKLPIRSVLLYLP